MCNDDDRKGRPGVYHTLVEVVLSPSLSPFTICAGRVLLRFSSVRNASHIIDLGSLYFGLGKTYFWVLRCFTFHLLRVCAGGSLLSVVGGFRKFKARISSNGGCPWERLAATTIPCWLYLPDPIEEGVG